MSDDPADPPHRPARRGLATRALGRLRAATAADQEGAIGVVERRALGVLGRLDRVAQTLERAANLEVQLLERMAPIVDDLAELVRHNLDEARERRGLAPKEKAPPATGDIVDIDVVAEEPAPPSEA